MNNGEPSLIEPGVHYFFRERLKNCHVKRTTYNDTLINIAIGLCFIVVMVGFLYGSKYLKKSRAQKESEQRELIQYMQEKVRKIQEQGSDLIGDGTQNETITNLPEFENVDFMYFNNKN